MSLAMALACALAAAVPAGEADSAQLVAEVKAANAAWAEAAASKGVERMLDFYDEDGVFIAQDGTVAGRQVEGPGRQALGTSERR